MHDATNPSQSEVVTLRLRQMIMEGEFGPGTRLLEVQLAQALGVSRTPLRLALEVLARDGLLKGESRRGFTVAEITIDEIADAFDVRGALERLAVRRIGEKGLSTATRIALQEFLDRGADLLAKGHFDETDTRAWNTMNAGFHDALVCATASRPLVKALERNSRLPLVDAGAIAFNAGNLDIAYAAMRQAQAEHTDIVDALIRRQASRAEALIEEHIHQARESLRRELQRFHAQKGAPQVPGLRLVVG